MAELWEQRNTSATAELFTLAHRAFDLRARSYLVRDYRLDEDTVEDCIGDAVEALLKAWREYPTRVHSPYSWLWAAAKNRCKVLVRTAVQIRHDAGIAVEYDDELSGSVVPDVVAETWVEELGDIELGREAGREWVRDVVLAAVNELPPRLNAVALEMLRMDANALADSAEATERLGLTGAAWRQNKKRVMDALRVSIPRLITEMGISLTPREEQSLFQHRHRDIGGDDAELVVAE